MDQRTGSGQYSARISISTRGAYRFRAVSSATSEWPLAATGYSKTLKAKRIASLGRPRTPSVASRGARFTVWGTLKPSVSAGSKTVGLRLYRYSSGKWNYVKTYGTVNANYSSYSRYVKSIRLWNRGYYRFKAVWPESSTWARSSSSYSYRMRVR